MENYELFPNNVFEPTKKKINNFNYDFYKMNFRSLSDLYKYLTSNPVINHNCFPRLASEREGFDFAGKDYDTALSMLMGPVDKDYAEFLALQKQIDNSSFDFVTEYVSSKSTAGGVIDIPSYVTGSPLCYRSEIETFEPKFVRINLLLSYYCGTTKEQVQNRALIVTALVNALERAGYSVDINTFALSKEGSEVLDVNVNIKNSNDTLNKANLIKSLCYVEFFRRLIFRVKETSLVTDEEWGNGYGCTVDKDFARQALNLSSNDIYIDQPRDLGIKGDNLLSDFKSAVKRLNVTDKIDVKESISNLEKEVKTLKLTR